VATELQIVNKALSLLGEGLLTAGQLTTPDDSTSRAVAAILPSAKQAVLRETSPQCARRYASLSNAPIPPPNPDFIYAKDLPSDCLRVIRVLALDEPVIEWYGAPVLTRWRVSGKYLLVDIEGVAIEYTANISYTDFDPLLSEAMVAYLAWQLCGAIADASASTMEFWSNQYARAASLAQGIDEAEGQIDRISGYSTLASFRHGR
jgi:hypothetical protein